MNEMIQTDQALTFALLGKGFGAQATRQAIIADRKFDETDLIQAQAAISLGKAGENPRYQPQTPPGANSENS